MVTEITLRVNGQNQRVAVDDPNTPLLYACAAPSSVVDLANAALVASSSRVD
jgi:hypothetical protein